MTEAQVHRIKYILNKLGAKPENNANQALYAEGIRIMNRELIEIKKK